MEGLPSVRVLYSRPNGRVMEGRQQQHVNVIECSIAGNEGNASKVTCYVLLFIKESVHTIANGITGVRDGEFAAKNMRLQQQIDSIQ